MTNYEITKDDLVEMSRRMARKETCCIPVRVDITLTDGQIAKNCLTWGSPEAYELVEKHGVILSKLKWEDL